MILCSCEKQDKGKTDIKSTLIINVLDSFSAPIEGAEIRVLNDEEYQGVADSVGKCTFSGLSSEVTTIIRIDKQGYQNLYASIVLLVDYVDTSFILEPIGGFFEGFEDEISLSGLQPNQYWKRTDTVAHSGNYCLIMVNEYGHIGTTVTVEWEPMLLSFWYKYDVYWQPFQFAVDWKYYYMGENGQADWSRFQIVLPEGSYSLYWTSYTKGSKQDNYMCIDDISFSTFDPEQIDSTVVFHQFDEND
jgi:hypothetical protein